MRKRNSWMASVDLQDDFFTFTIPTFQASMDGQTIKGY